MLAKRTKVFILIFLLFALCAMVVSIMAVNVRRNSPTPPDNSQKAPVRVVLITLDQSQHDQIFEQFRNFAAKHAFAIRISQTDPTGEHFLVQMWREDVRLIGEDSLDPGLFDMGFYNTYEERPVPVSVIDYLVDELRGFIEEIPDTTFTVVE
jgi:hypothetical protein